MSLTNNAPQIPNKIESGEVKGNEEELKERFKGIQVKEQFKGFDVNGEHTTLVSVIDEEKNEILIRFTHEIKRLNFTYEGVINETESSIKGKARDYSGCDYTFEMVRC